jgi:hypothetical protein
MKRLIKRKILLCAVALMVGALPATAQKKKSDVKVNYDKFKDLTCASIYVGNISHSFASDVVVIDASYCSRGQKLEVPTMIELRLYSKAWLGVISQQQVIFLLDGSERLTFVGNPGAVTSRILGDCGSITLEVQRGELLRISSAKLAEFQLGGAAYKLKEKELSKLKDLAESGSEAENNPVESVSSNTQPTNTIYGVSLKGFEHLEDGMTYAQVVSILGKEGTPTMDSNIGGRHMKMYQWKEKGGRAIIHVMFTDDKLKQKIQVGFE